MSCVVRGGKGRKIDTSSLLGKQGTQISDMDASSVDDVNEVELVISGAIIMVR